MTSIAEQVGRVVGGRYRLLAPVGTGASSQVYAASDTRLARRVAVKVLHRRADEQVRRRLLEEARGENGFGYDPVFYFPDRTRTYAEATAEEKNFASHRGKAFQRLLDLLIRLD